MSCFSLEPRPEDPMYITYREDYHAYTLERQSVCARVCMVRGVCVNCECFCFVCVCSVLVVLVTVGLFGCVVAKVLTLLPLLVQKYKYCRRYSVYLLY